MTEPAENPKPKRRKKRKRATKREIVERIDTISKLVLLGAEFPDLREFVSENTDWGISGATLRRYQAHALKKFVRIVEQQSEKNFARHVMQRRTLYARALESGDFRSALAIAKDEAELLGLYPDKLDDLAKRLAELEKRKHDTK